MLFQKNTPTFQYVLAAISLLAVFLIGALFGQTYLAEQPQQNREMPIPQTTLKTEKILTKPHIVSTLEKDSKRGSVSPSAQKILHAFQQDAPLQSTLLNIAVYNNDMEMVKYLIANGMDINQRDEKGLSPLMVALQESHEEIIELLMNHQADVFQTYRAGEKEVNMLYFALMGKGVKMIQELKNAGLSYADAPEVYAYAALERNRMGNEISEILEFIDINHPIVFYGSDMGSVLDIALNGRASEETITYLLDNGIRPNEAHAFNREMNEIHKGVTTGRQPHIFERLIELGADINHQDRFAGLTPLMLAVVMNDPVKTEILLKAGADTSLKDNAGHSITDHLNLVESETARKQLEALIKRYQ